MVMRLRLLDLFSLSAFLFFFFFFFFSVEPDRAKRIPIAKSGNCETVVKKMPAKLDSHSKRDPTHK